MGKKTGYIDQTLSLFYTVTPLIKSDADKEFMKFLQESTKGVKNGGFSDIFLNSSDFIDFYDEERSDEFLKTTISDYVKKRIKAINKVYTIVKKDGYKLVEQEILSDNVVYLPFYMVYANYNGHKMRFLVDGRRNSFYYWGKIPKDKKLMRAIDRSLYLFKKSYFFIMDICDFIRFNKNIGQWF